MALERQFVDHIVDRRREKKREQDKQIDHARSATGLPRPGQSLF